MNATEIKHTTEAAAMRLGVKGQSMRARFCETGSYFGIVPTKLPNGRLLWDAEAIETLIKGKAA
jgi:hypothetical protein